MKQSNQEFGIRLRSKIGILFLLLFVGIPMLYAAYKNFQVQKIVMGSLMVALFLSWAAVITVAFNFRIELSDNSIQRDGIFSPKVVDFADIEAIHFGTMWSNFYVKSGETKLYVSKDFKDYDDIIHYIVDRVQASKELNAVELTGKTEHIEEYTSAETAG